MSSNFVVNDLNAGRSLPIKLKNIMQRPMTGQYAAFNKLAEIISSNFNCRKSNKQNKHEVKTAFIIKQTKNVRINSVKQPSLSRPKSIPHNEQCFTQFFEYFASNRDAENKFRPYREQESYVPKERQVQSSTKPRKKATTVNKKYEPPLENRFGDTKSIFGQWQTEKQNPAFSILLGSTNNE